MKIKSLRKFLFLDTDTVSDYLAALEGSVLIGPIEETEQETKTKGAGADAKLFKADIGSEGSTQTRRKRAVNAAAQFQRLYELLESEDGVQLLAAFDKEIWDQLERGEILEIEARIRLPEPFILAQAAKTVPSIFDSLEPFKGFLDDETKPLPAESR